MSKCNVIPRLVLALFIQLCILPLCTFGAGRIAITDASLAASAAELDAAGTATPFFPVLSGRMINILSVSNNEKRWTGARFFLAQ